MLCKRTLRLLALTSFVGALVHSPLHTVRPLASVQVEVEPAKPLWNVPNALTAARLAAVPVFSALFCARGGAAVAQARRRALSAGVFALAALTDWLDGFLARRLQLETPFGAFFDPVADKLMARAHARAALRAGARARR